ncbi:MAG: amino acid adenylation domain-containing protein [Iphinoe sp. HA4291-MV1]|jgi:amino acid adenylation domain-containing protein|nr:amino acid adenylation domain-containing protein [Iphinoe sp. HA4291-MV1]
MKNIEEFLSDLANLDIQLWVESVNGTTLGEVRLRCNAPKGRLTPDIRAQLAERKVEIINFLQQVNLNSNSSFESITPVPRNIDLPLSFAQTRLWFIDQLEGEAAYGIPLTMRLIGSLNVVALEMAVQEIIRRHEVLRTTFKMVNGSPAQVITPTLTITVPIIDLQHLPKQEQSTQVQWLANNDFERPFSLSNGPLLRVSLLRLGEQSHVLLLAMHHIISDGWSMGVFIRELSALYEAFCAGKPSPLPELPIQYADFAAWQRQWLTGEVLQTQLGYWKQQLAGAPPLLELPTDRPRPSVQTFQGGSEEFELNRELTQKLKILSKQSGVTLFMTLLAAFATLLSRYSGQDDIVIGSLIANRNRSEIESLIGFFINILVLRTQFQGNPTFGELLERVREITLGAYAHQDLPFEKLVEELQPERSLSHAPLYQVMFILQNASDDELELPGLTLTPLELEGVAAKDDLLLAMEETEAGLLSGELVYKSDLFDATTIRRMIGHFQTLLESIVASPQQSVAQLPMLSAAERHQLLIEWNDTQVEYPRKECFPQLFEAQVALTPDAVAVVFENQQLTYDELNARANRWARHLVEFGVGPETIVALLLRRNIDFLTAILAVFKAGGAYLPLNPQHPVERIRQVLEQSQVPLVLSASEFEPIVISALGNLEGTAPKLLRLEEMDAQQHSSENLPVRSRSDNLAYVIYTSGSTGLPKGAMLEHRGMLNHLYAKVETLELSATDVVAQTATQTFDISVWQFLAALLVGGRVEIVRHEIAATPAQLLKLVETQGISILEIVPSLLRMILQEIEPNGSTRPQLSELRWLLLTGEALPPQLCRQWLEYYPTIPMLNAYGPTECSDDVTHYPICEPPSEEILNLPIGRPVLNTQLYVLDSQLQPAPIGVAGELYVGGVGVGRGYLNNPQQTQRAFLADPFIQQEGARLYKTGDKARYLSDGNIEFLGRIDYQVKIRGFRIELGEIEAILSQNPCVQEAVVNPSEDQSANKRLVAYVVPNPELTVTSNELRSFLKEKLPDYMVPSAFVTLEKMPLSPNGKVDRKALPAPDFELGQDSFVAPRTPSEEILAQLWAQVLDLKQVGIHDNFFELGGHSLLATQVISRLRSVFEVDLPLRRLFEFPTVAELSEFIEVTRHTDLGLYAPAIKSVPRNADLPLSFAQTRLWFLDQLEGKTATYNIPDPLRLIGSLNVAALEMAIQEIVRRHEILRTTFKMVNGSPVQVIAPSLTVALPMIDLQHLPQEEQSTKVGQLASEEAQRPFDLSNGPLLRVTLLRLEEQSHVLLLVMHHIVSDGWSMGVLIHELSALYEAFCAGEPSPLPELPIQYADFAAWQREWLSGEVLQTQLDYWKQQLAGAPPLLELPTDRPRPAVQTFQGGIEEFQLSWELTLKLKTLSQQSGVTLFMTLLAAFTTLLSRYSGQEDIVVGSAIANRNHSEIESLIGFFVNTLVLRTQLQGNPTFSELLERVREMTLGAYAHQDLPFEKLVEELQPERSLSYSPLFQVMFILQNTPGEELELPGLTITPFVGQEEVTATHDLLLSMEETEAGLSGELVYNSDLFDATTIARMIAHFQNLLEGIVANQEQSVAQLPLLSTAEQHQLLFEWNDTQVEYPTDKCIHQLFEQQVERTPDAVAVVFENQQLTYQQLNARANQLAHYLKTLGVEPEILVGICVERSLEMIVGLLGILKAGGAYVPLDPAYPQERLSFMLSDSQVKVLLTQQKLAANLPEHTAPVVCLDADWGVICGQTQDNPSTGVQASNLAYVIYTSGSTGKPKGVLVAHQGLCNLALEQIRIFDVQSHSRVLQFASFSFDASISEVVMTLCAGARLCLGTRESLLPGPALISLMHNQAITHATLPPSALAAMPTAELPDWQTIIVAGEACPPNLVAQWSSNRRFFNGYGPTESTVCATTAVCTDGESVPPIGRPLANTQVYILDCHLQSVPIGVPGELYIGGAGLARGYLNRPELTLEKFIPNPFENSKFKIQNSKFNRLYKTGDKARYLPDGNIEFLGRIDQQVKIRGFRIELGEIEALLSQHPSVQEAVAIAREDQPGNKQLVGYVVPNSEPGVSTTELRNFLKEKLPEYMVPSAVVSLEKMPLTPNGKVDRRALPAPDMKLSLKDNFVPPSDILELQLVQIWEQVLDVHPIGVRDNFFDLGGHSLLAISLMARIQQQFGKNLPLAALFQVGTIEHLASLLRASTDSPSWSTLVPIQSGGFKRPFFCVHPGVGTVLAYVDLARHLDPEQPFYGLESLGLDEEHKPYTQVEDMAAHYIEAMQTVQPQGPYLLGGWSFGGLVAFEMAQQLQAQGQQVSLLALLDTYPVTEDEELNEADDVAFLEDLLTGNNGALLGIPPELELAQAQRLQQVFKSHIQAANNYSPQPYPGKITLFLAQEEVEADSEDLTLGWNKLANQGVELHLVPGDHYSMISKPNVQVLAEKLQVYLERSQTND